MPDPRLNEKDLRTNDQRYFDPRVMDSNQRSEPLEILRDPRTLLRE
jgi:hypothetical protein